MRSSILLACLLLSGCATELDREGRCLAALTPDFLEAQAELTSLEATWRASPSRVGASDANPSMQTIALAPDREQVREAERKLREARLRHQSTLDWYERVYQRVRMRMEERQLQSEVFWTLAPGPALVFYPLVQWNLHSVMWDGVDPDAESDPIRRFCMNLTATQALTPR